MRHDDPERRPSHTVLPALGPGVYAGAPTAPENHTVFFDRTPLVHIIAELAVNTAVETRNGK